VLDRSLRRLSRAAAATAPPATKEAAMTKDTRKGLSVTMVIVAVERLTRVVVLVITSETMIEVGVHRVVVDVRISVVVKDDVTVFLVVTVVVVRGITQPYV